ncbi:MAG: carboxypeptidase regulatory-like domain-containing protein [Bryobacteraceae bacterium]
MKSIVLRCLLLALLTCPAAWMQSTYGTLLGVVTDSSGGVVANARIQVTETNTGISKETTTDSHGTYELPNLQPGTYQVAIIASGFDKYVRANVPLDPRASVRVDVTLAVGSTKTTVEVQASAPVITTESGTVSDVAKGKEISELPINYRANSTSPFNAITIVPNVQVDSGGALGFASFSIAGNHPAQNEVSVDGFSITSPRSNGPLVEVMPSTEQISEMKVTSQLAPAEYGQIGDIAFIGKGGTNQFHGSAFEYFQNDALDAQPLFTSDKPKKRDNNFGGAISGPVLLPHFNGKDRTFFFVDYERNMQRSEASLVNSVPTPAMLSGDFSTLGTQLINPFTNTPFAGNRIPTSLFNPVSQNILNTFFPSPTTLNADPLDPTDNYLVNIPQPITTDLYDIRLDQKLSEKQSIFGRFSWKNQPSSFAQDLGTKTGSEDVDLAARSVAISHNYSIKANLLNEFRFGYLQQRTNYTYPKFPKGAQLISSLGLQGLGPFPPGSAEPDFNFEGSSSLTGTPGAREERLSEHKFQIADNLTWIRGRHTIKTGFDLRILQSSDYINFQGADNFGNYYFNDTFTGYDFADFLLGLPTETDIANAGSNYDGHAKAYGFFVQDSFKVNPKLTVEYGLRYEYHPPFHDNTLQMTNFNDITGAVIVPNAKSLSLASTTFLESINACGLPAPNPTSYGLYPCTPVQTAKQAGFPETLRFSDKTKFLPRLSFAYRLNDKTVIRAGGGLFDQTLLGDIFYALIGIHTSDYRTYLNSITGSGQPAYVFPNTHQGGLGEILPAGNADFGTATQQDLRDPYSEQWSFTVERDLGASTGLRVTYTGLHSVGLLVSPDWNQIRPQAQPYDPSQKPFPNWEFVKTYVNAGTSQYHGLETVVTHRFSQGLFFQSSWIWSKNLSDADGDAPNDGFTGETGRRLSNRFDIQADRGNVAYTRRHRWLTTANIEIPFGRGKKYGANMNRVLDGFVGGWQSSNILILQTGPYQTPTYTGGNDPSGTDAVDRPGTQRPDRLPASACSGLSTSDARLLQGSCFYYGWPDAIGRFGNSGVGILEAPGTVLWNTGLAKNFVLAEPLKLRFEATATNVLNHPNFAPPGMTANRSSFGVINSLQPSEGAGARVLQLAVRLDF